MHACIIDIPKTVIFYFLASKNMSNQNFTISANHTTIRKKKNESSGTKLLTPAYFSSHYIRISNGGVRQEEFCVPDKKCEMSGGKYAIQKKRTIAAPRYCLLRHILTGTIYNCRIATERNGRERNGRNSTCRI